MKQALVKFFRDEDGATAIEYGLLAGLISVVIVGTLQLIGPALKAYFDTILAAITPPA